MATSSILAFLGAAQTVTGSRFLVETGGRRLLVDCGLFQGLKKLRLRNWDGLGVDPASIDAVVLSHAHLDHSGYLPALVRGGFRGDVFATPDTAALCEIVLPDSGHIQEEDAAFANRRGFSKHKPALPLYTEDDARRALDRFRLVDFRAPFQALSGVEVELRRAGHILGAASVHVQIGEADLLVSGDLGRSNHPLLLPPEPPSGAATVLIESTYGNRIHEDEAGIEAFAAAIRRTAERSGAVLIPAFAVDRTEVLLFHLKKLVAEGRIPDLPVYVDSPMALAALRVYRAAIESGSADVRPGLGDAPFDPGTLIEARDTADSKAIHDAPLPAIIISASGMVTGGRILHHMERRLPDPRNTVVLVGFQAAGTRGQKLQNGANSLKLHGRYVPIHADVVSIPAFSVHADRDELVAWLASAEPAPRSVFVVHGEKEAAASLRDAAEAALGCTVVVPQFGERIRLD